MGGTPDLELPWLVSHEFHDCQVTSPDIEFGDVLFLLDRWFDYLRLMDYDLPTVILVRILPCQP